MRKTILTIGALLATLAAGAQTFVTTMPLEFNVIPAPLTLDGAGRIVLGGYYDDDNYPDIPEFQILNEQLQLEHTINPIVDSVELTLITQVQNSNNAWVESENNSGMELNSLITLKYYDIARMGDGIGTFYLTQNLFNSSAEMEYLLPNYSGTFTVEQEAWDGSPIRQIFSNCQAYNVMSENGSIVENIQAPDGYALGEYGSYYIEHHVDIVQIGSSRYLVIRVTSTTDRSRANAWYSLDEETNSVSLVQTIPMNVRPSMAERGQEITVELGEGSQTSELKVIDAQGRILKHISVQPGQREVRIPTAGLGRGMHFVGSPKQGTVKVILR